MPIIGSFGAGSGKGFGLTSGGAPDFICATGGTITESGDYRIHTFTGPGTFEIKSAKEPTYANVDYIVVAGGGGGTYLSGGGGAGGYRESHSVPVSGCYTASPLATPTAIPVSVTSYPITIGGGGAGGNCAPGSNGTDSIFSTITSTGGGGAGLYPGGGANPGGSGAGRPPTPSPVAGSGNTPPVSPPQGNPGGDSSNNFPNIGAGGGGGAGGAGGTGVPTTGGAGGVGVGTEINSSPTVGTPGPSGPLRYFAGGGGGGVYTTSGGGAGGYGGGGNGTAGQPAPVKNGVTNTGGGAGGGGPGSDGGSGIVIIRYKYK